MTTPADLYRSISALSVSDMVLSIFTRPEMLAKAVEILREQWTEGIADDGLPIGSYKNKYYAQKKNSMNPKPGFGFVDLMLTHALERGLVAKNDGDSFHFESTDSKFTEIYEKYEDAFGLSPDSKGLLQMQLYKEFMKVFTDKTGLKFV